MDAHHPVDLAASWWFLGWLLAVVALFVLSLALPLHARVARQRAWLYNVVVAGAIIGVAALANVAVSLHDMHLDLTREKVFTPSERALEVVDRLQRPVRLTYFFRGEDQAGKRAADIVQVMGRRNPLLQVRTVDPDKEPSLARNAGVELYNAAVLEAGERRVTVRSVDETEIAIGIQRVLRERVVTVCFLEGHQEYPMDAFEFHTHFEAGAGHSHDDATSAVIQTTGHGVGRMRRVLEGLGYDVRVVTPAVEASIPQSCSLAINAGPRTTYLPAESRALEAYLEQGGSLLLLFDLGFVLEPRLASLLARLGMRLPQQVLIDPKSHFGKDPETVAVTAYDPDPITRNVSLSFFPGVRPLELMAPSQGIRTRALVRSSVESYTVPVVPVAQRAVTPVTAETASDAARGAPGARAIVAVANGSLSDSAPREFRVVVAGDADFATNSFFPYMANSDLALALVRWLAREERATAIASRIPVPSLVLLTDGQARAIFVVLEVLMPLGVILIGTLVWWRRR